MLTSEEITELAIEALDLAAAEGVVDVPLSAVCETIRLITQPTARERAALAHLRAAVRALEDLKRRAMALH